jgi:hypothetical protein
MKPMPLKLPLKRPCPKCGAGENETCKENGQVIRGFHSARWPKEDASEAAARIVREDTEDH